MTRIRITAAFAAAVLTLAACGDDNDGDASADPPRSACVIVGEIAAATPPNPASAGPEVECVQRQLARLGYPVEPTGTYDAATVEAVAQFFEDEGLRADPKYLGQTAAALGVTVVPPWAVPGASGPIDGSSPGRHHDRGLIAEPPNQTHPATVRKKQ